MQRMIQSVLGVSPTEKRATRAVGEAFPGPRENWEQKYGIRHVAIIPDGNRRWAKERSVPAMIGHSTGLLQVLPSLVRGLSDRGVHTLTAWGFSTENWKRHSDEVNHLMTIFEEFLQNRLLDLAAEYDARIIHLGRKDRMPDRVARLIENVESKTAHGRSHVYNMALDYGGEDELQRAALRMAEARGTRDASTALEDYLDTAGQPHPTPDILVRSSGETRLSGFMPLQAAYSELFFVDRHFPEFNMELMQELAESFLQRKRRFGE